MIYKKSSFIVMLISGLLAANDAYADFLPDVSVNVSRQQDASYLYTYTVTNLSGSDLPIVALGVDVSRSSSLTGISNPDGWDPVYSPGFAQIVWSESDPFAFTPIYPGSSAVFSFVSSLPPILQGFEVDGLDSTGQFPASNFGQIVAPGNAVPEPTSMIPLGIGMMTLAGYNAYRSRKPSE